MSRSIGRAGGAALPRAAALIMIDVQNAIDAPYWGRRNNPDAERNMAALLAAWRVERRPLYHVRHDSTSARGSR